MLPQNDYADLIPFSDFTFVFYQSSQEEVYAAIKDLKKEGSNMIYLRRNTELAVFLIKKMLPAFEVGSNCICVFLYFSACFDTISKYIFFVANYIGMELGTLNSIFLNVIFKIELSLSRIQLLNHSFVSKILVKFRAQTRSPDYLILYSNDMNAIFMNNENVLYADDTANIACVGDDLIAPERSVNSIIARLLDWCRFNKLFLNPSKYGFMLITNKYDVHIEPNIIFGSATLARASNFKYLGIHLDDKQKYNLHLDYIKARLSQFCGVTYRLKNYFTPKSAKICFMHAYSTIYSFITYCVTVWGGVLCCTATGAHLQNYHNRIVINLFSKHRTDLNCCIFKMNNLLKLGYINTF